MVWCAPFRLVRSQLTVFPQGNKPCRKTGSNHVIFFTSARKFNTFQERSSFLNKVVFHLLGGLWYSFSQTNINFKLFLTASLFPDLSIILFVLKVIKTAILIYSFGLFSYLNNYNWILLKKCLLDNLCCTAGGRTSQGQHWSDRLQPGAPKIR